MRLYLGPRSDSTSAGLNGYLDNFTVWDGVMTLEQHLAMRGTAANASERKNARRRRPKQSDCGGVMTLLATFDGQYDAEVAGGSSTAHWMVGAAGYDQFARIDDGSRSRGERMRFLLGMPRHDNSEDDRIPIRAVFPVIRMYGADQFTALVDAVDHSEINVSALTPIPGVGQGVAWIRSALDPDDVMIPATLRMRVALPDATNPTKTRVCLGPVLYVNGGMHGTNFGSWGTGEMFAVVADPANTASQFKTNLSGHSDGYWNGAELSLHTGACANCRLKITGYNSATGVVTVAGALPAVPAAGDSGMADFRGRLIPIGNPPNELQSMEAWLWEEYGADRPWTEIECVYGGLSGSSVLRYQRGRTAWMDLIRDRGWEEGSKLMLGRTGAEALPESFACNILIESLIIEGPGSYQVMAAEDSRVGRGFETGDSFMLRDLASGHSSRVWRWENCKWNVTKPTINLDPAVATADLAAAGTWRHSAYLQSVIKPNQAADHVIGAIRGTDAGGTQRLGFARGTWDATVNRIRWQDEAAPEGRTNPFLEAKALRPHFTSDSTWGVDGLIGVQILQTPDGKWSLLYTGTEGNPDHYFVRALHGAEDRWSFDPDTQWWPENPVLPGFGGVDKIAPEFGGMNLFGNRDAEWCVSYNPYARDKGRRFAAYCRFKTLLPIGGSPGNAKRPVAGWTSPDLKSFFMLPHGNALTPLPIGELFVPTPFAVSDDVMGMMAEFYGGTIRLWASDDDRHFQEVCWDFMPDAGPGDVFRLGDKRIYSFWTSQGQNFSYIGFNRETNYELVAGQTSGMIETPVLMKPRIGWGPLLVNVDPCSGTVKVEVVDARTEEPVPGFAAADCDTLAEGLEKSVTWKTLQLSEVTAEAIRLRFVFARANAASASPKLYEWRLGEPPQVQRPSVERLTVEGRVNPAGVVDDTPTFGWSYRDFGGLAQSAYQVLVASSEERLAAGDGDLWNSGVVVSAARETVYGGGALDDQTTYFWKVRVQNAEGVWSEEW
jgi:hypothetical protein